MGSPRTASAGARSSPALGRDHDVIAVDAPGHGQASDVRADLWQTSDLLAANGRATFVGYSMGARMALHVALSHPDLVEGLALVSGTAGIEDPDRTRSTSRARRGARAIDSSVTASTPSSLGGSTSRCSRRCRRALGDDDARRDEHRRRPRVEPPARRHGHARSSVGSARRAHDARARRLGRARRALHQRRRTG